MNESQQVYYRDVQYMRNVSWVMLLIIGIAGMMWWGFFQQILLGKPWGSKPASDFWMWILWLIFGIGFPLSFYWMRLIVEVREEHLYIRFVPISRMEIPVTQIKTATTRTYSPLGEYGGWGIRGLSSRRAYSISGNRGVQLELIDGRIVMIGSDKPEALEMAIRERLPAI